MKTLDEKVDEWFKTGIEKYAMQYEGIFAFYNEDHISNILFIAEHVQAVTSLAELWIGLRNSREAGAIHDSLDAAFEGNLYEVEEADKELKELYATEDYRKWNESLRDVGGL